MKYRIIQLNQNLTATPRFLLQRERYFFKGWKTLETAYSEVEAIYWLAKLNPYYEPKKEEIFYETI